MGKLVEISNNLARKWSDWLEKPVSVSARRIEHDIDEETFEALKSVFWSPSGEDQKNQSYQEFYSSFKNVEVRRAWAESRRCLLEVLSSGHSQVLVSLSHTKDVTIAVAIEGGVFLGVGVDVEISGRKVHPRVERRLIRPSEKVFGLSPILFWSIKEAVYKASPENLGTTLSQYEIQTLDDGAGECLGPKETFRTMFQFSEIEGHIFAIAATRMNQ